MRVLVIEDDRSLGGAVRDQLMADGHAADWAQSLGEADDAVAVTDYDLVLLDLMLPDGFGVDFLRRMRAGGDSVPVIILTARDRISDRIAGLNAGADDYLVKPFDLAEMSARIAAVARRYAGSPNPVIAHGDLEIDLTSRMARRAGAPVRLTGREWSVLEALLQNPGVVMSRTQLEDRLYEHGSEIESNAIEVHVSRLRRKLGRRVIDTVRGIGYRLGEP